MSADHGTARLVVQGGGFGVLMSYYQLNKNDPDFLRNHHTNPVSDVPRRGLLQTRRHLARVAELQRRALAEEP